MHPLPESVRRSLAILRVHEHMTKRKTKRSDEDTIARVVAAFDTAGTRWTLVGAHAVGAITEPRATDDFDFVIEASKLGKVLRRLESDLGPLETEDIGAAVKIKRPRVDLIRSTTHALFLKALGATRNIGTWRIPETELLIALKFLSSVNPWRGQRARRQDILDLIAIVESLGADALDREKMLGYAALVYPGAQNELAELLDKVERGDRITI